MLARFAAGAARPLARLNGWRSRRRRGSSYGNRSFTGLALIRCAGLVALAIATRSGSRPAFIAAAHAKHAGRTRRAARAGDHGPTAHGGTIPTGPGC